MNLAPALRGQRRSVRGLLGEVRLPIHQEHVSEILTRDVDKMLEVCERVDRVADQMESGQQAP